MSHPLPSGARPFFSRPSPQGDALPPGHGCQATQLPCCRAPRFAALSSRRSRSGITAAFYLITAWFLSTACAPVPPVHSDRQYAAPEVYPGILERYTRETQLYRQLETSLLARGTLLTPAFQQAYVAEYARAYRLSPASQRDLEARVAGEWGTGVFIELWVASREPRLASLAPVDGIWKLELFDDEGHGAAPESVELVKHPTAVEQHFFPYTARLGLVYRLKFPASPEGGKPFLSGRRATLQFSGVLGTAELSWNPGADAAAVPGSAAR